jgi:hypothetical protein
LKGSGGATGGAFRALARPLILLSLLLLLFSFGTVVAVFAWPQPTTASVSGTVTDTDGPVAGALVRVQTTANHTYTADDGGFTIDGLPTEESVTLVAWAEGYIFGWTEAHGGDDDVSIALHPHNRVDNSVYDWEPSANCGECHPSFAEWERDAHSQSAVNVRFLTMYNGTDVEGNRSRNSNYYTGLPRTRDPDDPYYGPGFKLDFPKRDGNCAACHTPMASKLDADNSCGWNGCHMQETSDASDELPAGVSPNEAVGVAAEGISCDFCHKIGAVNFYTDTVLPDPAMPGILSLTLYRPKTGEDLLMGTVDDVARPKDSFNQLHGESAFCSACHYGVNDTTEIYNSYGEWLDSPYSSPDSGQTCQDCHMPVAPRLTSSMETVVQTAAWLENASGRALPAGLGKLASRAQRSYFVFPEKGGLFRELEQIHLHQMPGSTDEQFLKSAIALEVRAEIEGAELVVNTQVSNTGAGHHYPTGSPLRQVLLVVRATDGSGNELLLTEGGKLPDWAGDVAGEAGEGFAKILRDTLTGEEPTFSHWRLVELVEDTRIPAQTARSSTFRFAAEGEEVQAGQSLNVEVQLIYRRAFQQLQEWKGWTDPDIILASEQIQLDFAHPVER